jgi:hypothetical protein
VNRAGRPWLAAAAIACATGSDPIDGADPPDDSEPVDTEPVDVPDAAPPPLSFTDLTPAAVAASPGWSTTGVARPVLPVTVGDPTGACRPASCDGVCVVPACDRVVLFGVRGEVGVGVSYRWTADGALAPLPGPTLSTAGALDHPDQPYIGQLALLDLDGDGHDELLGGGVLSRWDGAAWQRDPSWPDRGACAFLPVRDGLGLFDLDRDGLLDVLSTAAEGGADCGLGPLYIQRATPAGWRLHAGFSDGPGGARQDLYAALARHLPDGRLQLVAWGRSIPDRAPGYTGVWEERAGGGDLPTFDAVNPGVGEVPAHHPMGGDWCATWTGADWRTLALAAPIGSQLLAFDVTDPSAWWDVSGPLAARTRWEHPWGTVCTDLDRDGRWDILANAGPNSELGTGNLTRVMAWWRPKDDGPAVPWPDADTGALGVARDFPWGRGLALLDLDHDGDLDVLDGAAEGDGRPRLLRNDGVGASLTLQLRGTLSNPLGVGALIDGVLPDGRRVRRHLGGAWQPGNQVRPQVELGLAGFPTVDVTVSWPDGTTQHVGDLAAGALYEVVQPAWLTLTEAGAPSDRAVPLGGALTATACGFDADGQPDTAPTLTLADATGAPTLTPLADPSPTCRAWRLDAGDAPGAVRLALTTAGGHAMWVRPRVTLGEVSAVRE